MALLFEQISLNHVKLVLKLNMWLFKKTKTEQIRTDFSGAIKKSFDGDYFQNFREFTARVLEMALNY